MGTDGVGSECALLVFGVLEGSEVFETVACCCSLIHWLSYGMVNLVFCIFLFLFFAKEKRASLFSLKAVPSVLIRRTQIVSFPASTFPLAVVGLTSSTWFCQAERVCNNTQMPPVYFFSPKGRGAFGAEHQAMTSSWHFPPRWHRKLCPRVSPDPAGSTLDLCRHSQTQAHGVSRFVSITVFSVLLSFQQLQFAGVSVEWCEAHKP